MKNQNALLLAVALSVIVFQFQNCSSPVSFQDQKSSVGGLAIDTVSSPVDPVVQPVPVTPSPVTTTTTPAPAVTPTCEAGQTLINGACVAITTSFTECTEFVDLDTLRGSASPGEPITIPSLDSSGKCYFHKIGDAIANHPSGKYGESRALDVLARNHDAPGNSNPYIMGEASLNLIFQGQRTVSLSSNPLADVTRSDLYIDNFFLVQTADQSGVKLLARGTADALPTKTTDNPGGNILVTLPLQSGDVTLPVTDFISYASGGTAHVGYIDISNGFTIGSLTNLRVRQLDCGGSAQASDIYLIIH